MKVILNPVDRSDPMSLTNSGPLELVRGIVGPAAHAILDVMVNNEIAEAEDTQLAAYIGVSAEIIRRALERLARYQLAWPISSRSTALATRIELHRFAKEPKALAVAGPLVVLLRRARQSILDDVEADKHRAMAP